MGVSPHSEAARTGAILSVGNAQIAVKPNFINTLSTGRQQQAKLKHKNMKTMNEKKYPVGAVMLIAMAM